MSSVSRPRRRGFTLLEVLVSATLLAVGIAAVVRGFGALTEGEYRVRTAERAQRLAMAKYEELVSTGQTDTPSLDGDFAEEGEPDYEWTAETLPTGVESLEAVTVTVVRRGDDRSPVAVAEGLVHRPLTASGGTAP